MYGRRESCSRLQVPAILDVITSKEAEEDIGRGKGSRGDSKKQLFKQKGFHPKKSAAGPILNVTKNKESLESKF